MGGALHTTVILGLVALLALSACSHKDASGNRVLGVNDMASLMADIYVSNSVANLNYAEFNSDSAKKALRLSVYEAHNVTSEQVESSLSWYGHHVEEYIKVCDATVKILEDRRDRLEASGMGQDAVESDSVNLWPALARQITMSSRSPLGRFLRFDLETPDSSGNTYILKYKVINRPASSVAARLLVDYPDTATSWVDAKEMTGVNETGWMQARLPIDTARGAGRVYGFIDSHISQGDKVQVLLDSVTLTRVTPAATEWAENIRTMTRDGRGVTRRLPGTPRPGMAPAPSQPIKRAPQALPSRPDFVPAR